jgi:hypothetical protein
VSHVPHVPSSFVRTSHAHVHVMLVIFCLPGTPAWQIAVLFSGKAIMQLVANPVIAPLVIRWGPQLVLLAGTIIMISSSIGFAYGTTFAGLLVVCSSTSVPSFSSPPPLTATANVRSPRRAHSFVCLCLFSAPALTAPSACALLVLSCRA